MLRIFKTSGALTLFSGLLLCLYLIPVEEVFAQGGRYGYQTRSSTSYRYSREGPNMCRVQHVRGTNEKFFTDCMSTHLRVICERPTYERWECCPGFFKQRNERGCTGEQPLDNLFNTTLKLNLIDFYTASIHTKMKKELSINGAYTVFAPSNEALGAASAEVKETMKKKDGELVKYHVIRGRLNMTNFRGRNVEFNTLSKGFSLYINKYPYGIATVNCARVLRPDAMATNGIMHVVDKVLHPTDVNLSLAMRISGDRRLTVFQQALNISGMYRRLKRRKAALTVLAPTDRAFNKIPRNTKERIMTDPDTARRVLERHIVRGVYCANAIVVSIGLRTMEHSRLLFRCKRDGMHVNEAKLVEKDIVGKNGVMHVIDKVLLPDSVKSVGQLMDDMHLNRFHRLFRDAGLKATLECGKGNITLFSPTNYAVGQMSSRYLSSLKRDRSKLQNLINYHIVDGRIYHNALVGDTSLKTKANTNVEIKVNVYRNGIRLDKAGLRTRPRECQYAVIHKLDRVLIPPEETFIDLLKKDRHLSKFAGLLNKSLKTWSLNPVGSYTLLVPNNRAFSFLDSKTIQPIFDNPTRLKRFIQRHFINRMVMRSTIPKQGSYGIKSMQGDETIFSYNRHRSLVVNKHSKTISEDMIATNGIMYIIDHVLPCKCERMIRTIRRQYINSRSYRRVY